TGQLVTVAGNQVLGTSGPIVFQPTDHDINISPDGTVTVLEGASRTDSIRGKLRLVSFADAQSLLKQGGNLFAAGAGAPQQDLNVQVISNNIANLRTTGYKKQTAAFQDLIYEHIRRVGAQSSDQGTILPVGIDIGGGVKTVGTPRSMTQGTLSQTGNDLDLAITGEG